MKTTVHHFIDNECMGGVGISGSDREQDEAIARFSLSAIAAKFEIDK